MFLNNNVPMSPDNNVNLCHAKFQERNVPMFPVNNVPMSQDNNVSMFQNNNVLMFPVNNVPVCHGSNVNRFLWNNVLLHRQLMMENDEILCQRNQLLFIQSIVTIK